MGRRHQVFIIAKVRHKETWKYCGIAAFHWQFLYGEQVALAATRFITAVQNPLNGCLIQSDLETFDGYKTKVCDGFSVPCPYITMLYMKSSRVGVDDNTVGKCYPEDARGGQATWVNNDDGITIFDVTDPASPQYCMVSIWELESKIQPRCGTFRPMSAKEYIECYYPCLNPDLRHQYDDQSMGEIDKANIHRSYERLSNIKIIDFATLSEAWPSQYKYPAQKLRYYHTRSIQGHTIPPLATLTWIQCLNALLQEEYNAEQVEFLLQLPLSFDLIEAAKTRLATEARLPDNILPILSKTFTPRHNSPIVDLSVWPLSKGQLTKVAKLLPTCKILKLGGKVTVSLDEISEAIALLPILELVVVFDDTTCVEDLRRQSPAGVSIVHKAEFWEFVNNEKYWLQSEKPPEFIVVARKHSLDHSKPQYRGIGIDVINDPNLIIQGLRDSSRLKWTMTALTNCFGVNPRPYSEPFASSNFISHGSIEPQVEWRNGGATQWIFAYESSGPAWGGPNFGCHPRCHKYGFIYHQPGSFPRVMDIDGFAATISKERSDLPPIVQPNPTPDTGKAGFMSFMEELRYVLGENNSDGMEEGSHKPLYELWTAKEALSILVSMPGVQYQELQEVKDVQGVQDIQEVRDEQVRQSGRLPLAIFLMIFHFLLNLLR